MFDFIFLCLLCAAVLFILSYCVVYYCYTLLYRNTFNIVYVRLSHSIKRLLTYLLTYVFRN